MTPHEQYLLLGRSAEERTQVYRELFCQHIDKKMLHELRDSINQCRVLGNERFRDEIEKALQIKTTPESRGRPGKINVG